MGKLIFSSNLWLPDCPSPYIIGFYRQKGSADPLILHLIWLRLLACLRSQVFFGCFLFAFIDLPAQPSPSFLLLLNWFLIALIGLPAQPRPSSSWLLHWIASNSLNHFILFRTSTSERLAISRPLLLNVLFVFFLLL